MYYLSLLSDKLVMKELKKVLTDSKLKLLEKVLEDINLLVYEENFTKEQKLHFYQIKNKDGAFIINQTTTKILRMKIGSEFCKCILQKTKEGDYSDESINLVSLDVDNALIVEQIQDEILVCLGEYYKVLEQKKNILNTYLIKLEDRLNKELIIISLQKKD